MIYLNKYIKVMVNELKIGLSEIINEYAKSSGYSEEYAEKFRKGLLENKALLDEFIYYVKTNGFLGEYKIKDLSVADIVVYQIDYFKSAMDQDRLDMKFNPAKMVMAAFEEMMQMALDENRALDVKNKIMSVSGTDGTESPTSRY